VIQGVTKKDPPIQTQDIPFILWRMTVEKEDHHVEFVEDLDSDEDLASMYARTPNMNI
jgi:hypothetical protein